MCVCGQGRRVGGMPEGLKRRTFTEESRKKRGGNGGTLLNQHRTADENAHSHAHVHTHTV